MKKSLVDGQPLLAADGLNECLQCEQLLADIRAAFQSPKRAGCSQKFVEFWRKAENTWALPLPRSFYNWLKQFLHNF
jgi:hypothetical protein